jgi:leucyl aminopeptidase
MNLSLSTKTNPQHTLVLGIFEDGSLTASGKALDQAEKGLLSQLFKNKTISGKCGECLPVILAGAKHQPAALLVGCGKAKETKESDYRKLIIAAMKSLNSLQVKAADSALTEISVGKRSLAWRVKFHAEVSMEALYRFDHYKTSKDPVHVNKLNFMVDAKDQAAAKTALAQGTAIASGAAYAKDLGNEPSNVCTPSYLAHEAKGLVKEFPSIKLNVLDEKAMEKLGMGAILGVTKGSAEPAKLICLEYRGGAKKAAPVALVGKGITFDTGGNSLKSPDSMVGMKYDMCGAATVMGVFKAVAELKLPINLVGVIPAVENMPGGNAYKPEDILTSLSGTTIEVISTDAEGRLILCDALTYCERTYKPEVVIDIATLTGAVVIALGFHATGLMSNDQALADDLLKAGIDSHDRAWQLPLWDDYQEQIKSPYADIANTGGRSAGSITAGCFLSRFTKNMRWAHLDVAGTAAMMMGTSDRMATGRPVPMLVQYLLNHAGE